MAEVCRPHHVLRRVRVPVGVGAGETPKGVSGSVWLLNLLLKSHPVARDGSRTKMFVVTELFRNVLGRPFPPSSSGGKVAGGVGALAVG